MAKNLVPITRPFLSKFYDQFPFDPLPPDVQRLTDQLQQRAKTFIAERQKITGDDKGVESVSTVVPHKIDENLWRHREQVEEILDLMQKAKLPAAVAAADSPSSKTLSEALQRLQKDLDSCLSAIRSFQAGTTEKVAKMVGTFLPQDFRGTLIQAQRERSERRREAEVEQLVKGGGSIADKYQLLWQQQMDRRKMLAQLGNSSGAFKVIVTYLGGVPQVLLDFIKTINDHNGPMEEQRTRYGPPLYSLTSLVSSIHVFLRSWWTVFDSQSGATSELTALLEEACTTYQKETQRFLAFIEMVFDKSPFLITAEQAREFEPEQPVDDFKEQIVNRGESFEVKLTSEGEGAMVAWDFSVGARSDIGFSVDFTDEKGNKTPMLPYKRVESHEGHFFSIGSGTYTLMWDNSYSNFYRKVLRYKADAIPPELTVKEDATAKPSS